MADKRLLRSAPCTPGAANRLRRAHMAAERIEQISVRGSINQCTVVVLAMDFHQRPADLAQQCDTCRLIVDEDPAAAVRRLAAAQDQVTVIIEAVFAQKFARRMVLGNVEDRDDIALPRAAADKRGIATRAERKRQRIEEDRLAGTRLAGQHRKAGRKIDVEPFDQYDIADRQVGEHLASGEVWISFWRSRRAANRPG